MAHKLAPLIACAGLLLSPLGQKPPGTANTGGANASAKTTVLVYSRGVPLTEKVREIDTAVLAGEYYVGDGTGYNLHLMLKKDQKFECTWMGCLGVYGRASGDWSVDDKGVILSPVTSEGMLKARPLGRVQIVTCRDRYLLVQEGDRRLFDRCGPARFSCLHRAENEKLVDDEYSAHVKELSQSPRPGVGATGQTTKPPSVVDRAAKLIDAIANANRQPKVVHRPKGRPDVVALFPESYDWKEDQRVIHALDELYRDKTVAVWEQLVKSLDDRRYCIAVINQNDEDTHVRSVGDVCHLLAYARLAGVAEQHLPRIPGDDLGRRCWEDLHIDDLAGWRRKRSDKSVDQLQMEICDTAVREVLMDDRISGESKKVTCIRIEAQIRKLRKTKEPSFLGPTSFSGGDAVYTPNLARKVRDAVKDGFTGQIILLP
jgi:hypothetical protein